MEKKGSRSVQSSSKGLVADSKKNQDGTNGKQWFRGGRRREPSGASVPAKSETSRKPIPQRNKTVDKRPKPRGGYYCGVVGGKEGTRLDEHDAELGSVFVQGSKKQSLNHLLNFHLAPREGHWHSTGLSKSKSDYRWNTTHKHKYNKEQFLQANCQFVVNDSGDYTCYLNNPDALVNWDLIEQVNVQVTEVPSCPICLYPPVAAKMTRCGHIYCWSCVLHYLALSDKTWRKCPICFEAVHKEDLKSVVSVPHAAVNVNDNITFKLMKRARGSLTAYPIDQHVRDDNVLFNMSEAAATYVHSKLLIAKNIEILSIIRRERLELERQLFEEEKCFVEQATESLLRREAIVMNKMGLRNLKTELLNNEIKVPQNSPEECFCNFEDLEISRNQFESMSSDGACYEDSAVTAEDLDISNARQPLKYFYFYQASDGQHIYLHALNVRMLEHTYGSLEFCPKTITGCVVEKEGGSMTEELRKRLRYLQHLPVTCQFEVAEIRLKPSVVSKETLEHFQDQLDARRKHRQRRMRDEKRRERRITEEENKKLGKFPTANIHIESRFQFPEVGFEPLTPGQVLDDVFPASSSNECALPCSATSSTQSGNSSLAGSLNNESECSGMSFAKMLAMNKVRPARPIEPTASSNLSKFTGTRSKDASNRARENESDPDDYLPAPAYSQSFSDAVALALEKADQIKRGEGAPGLGKKKKKRKQKIIFATSMVYSGD